MTYAPITEQEWTEIEETVAGYSSARVTVSTTPEIHAAQEALNVAVFRWLDVPQAGRRTLSTENLEALDRVRWQAAQLRDAMNQTETF